MDKDIDKTDKNEIEALPVAEEISAADLKIIEEMARAGLMYGHKKSKTEPRFKKYVFATRSGMEIIDLGQTLTFLNSTIIFLRSLIKENKLVLMAATQASSKEAVDTLSKEFNFPRVNERWVGGLLTNFKVISKRIEHFKKLKTGLEKGEFEKYTKKERVVMNKDVERMRKLFGGLENLTRLPDAIFVIDSSLKNHMTAVREARQMNIPIIAIIDSDDNPDLINYFIPANDHSKMSIGWIINAIREGVKGLI